MMQMKCISVARRWALAAVAVSFIAAQAAIAQTAVLESSALRLEVNGGPYSYSVIEKSTGTVLARESQTQFTVGGTARTVSGASVTGQTDTTLDATLTLAGTSDTAHVTFRFVDPDVIEARLNYNNGTPTNSKEQFVDRGERNYGIWEFSYWGSGGALDNRGANNRNTLGLSNPPTGSGDPSGRAPFYWTSGKYGVYADTLALGRYTIGVGGQTSFNFDAPELTYYVIYGATPPDILKRYNTLADGFLMPPNWAFDPIFWRDDHHADLAANGVTNAQALVKRDADQLQAFQMPSAGMWIDRPVGTGTCALVGWGNMDFDTAVNGFPNPAAMIADLKSRNMHLKRVDHQPRPEQHGDRPAAQSVQVHDRVLRCQLHDHTGDRSPRAHRIQPLQAGAANRLSDAGVVIHQHGRQRVQDRPRRSGRHPGCAAAYAGRSDSEDGVRSVVRIQRPRRLHVLAQRLRPRSSVRGGVERRFRSQPGRRNVGLAEAASATGRHHDCDGRIGHRRLQRRPEQGHVRTLDGLQRARSNDGGFAGAQSDPLERSIS